MKSNQRDNRTVLIAAGGTGGHVFPALAVAERLHELGFHTHWLGTLQGIEADLVPKHSIPITYLSVTGLRGKHWRYWALAPIRLLSALLQSIRVILSVRPSVILGMGGFVTGPVGVAAWLLRKSLIIHEQNAVAGTTNRCLAPLAKTVLQAFPSCFKNAAHAKMVGNPIRQQFFDVSLPQVRYQQRQGPIRLLVLGGSRGALILNQLIPQALKSCQGCFEYTVWHQTGKSSFIDTKIAYQAANIPAKVEDFIENICDAYQWADLVICRAGAMTVSELMQVGVASILIPFPHAIDNHQWHNARHLSALEASILINQTDLTETLLKEILLELSDREKLQKMAERARDLSMPNATNDVTEQCLQFLD